MADDLVKRLREVKDWWREPGRTAEQAADRIEELQKLYASAELWLEKWDARIEQLEAALREIVDGTEEELTHEIARAALDGGKKDD